MKISFFGQMPGAKSLGSALIADIGPGEYTSLHAYVAFASSTGLENLMNVLVRLEDVRLFVGVDLHGTSFEVLEALLQAGIETCRLLAEFRFVPSEGIRDEGSRAHEDYNWIV
jgi:hypothetical protein